MAEAAAAEEAAAEEAAAEEAVDVAEETCCFSNFNFPSSYSWRFGNSSLYQVLTKVKYKTIPSLCVLIGGGGRGGGGS